MLESIRRYRPRAASIGAVLLAALSPVAGAQSLSLSYGLDPSSASEAPKPAPFVNRCSGLTWAVTLAASCVADITTARVASAVASLRHEAAPPPAATADAAATRRVAVVGAYSADEASPRRYELPTLGSPSESRVIRATGGRDDYIGSARNVDLNLRFGSKYRMRQGDEGWEVYKYSDVTAENRLPSSGVKAVGVELLVPFQ